MANASGKDLVDEVLFRINGRLNTGQILPYVNRAIYLISAAGSFKWDLQRVVGVSPVGGLWSPTISALIDSGKKIACYNSPSGTPIRMVSQDEIGDSAAGYVDQLTGTTEFNTFFIEYGYGSAGVSQAILHFLPDSNTGFIAIVYHRLPEAVSYSPVSYVKWDTPWMNDLVCDYAEAEISRILNLMNWKEVEDRFKAKLIEAKKLYSTERETTGPPEEVQAAIQERDQIGRG